MPHGGTVAVRWATHSDGRTHAKEYYDSVKDCRIRLAALAQQIASSGIVGKQPENGHRLKGDYSDLYELKPGKYRFMGFRAGRNFYLTNGAPKNAKRQDRDYDFALQIRGAVLKTLEKTDKR